MVVMDNSRFAKKYYKKFNIKTVAEQNDYASMREVRRRRFSQYLDPERTDEGFRRLPDVIFPGRRQGSRCGGSNPRFWRIWGIKTALFGLVKDNKHHTRAVV